MEEWLYLVTKDTVIDAMTLIVAAVGRTKIVTAKIEVLGIDRPLQANYKRLFSPNFAGFCH